MRRVALIVVAGILLALPASADAAGLKAGAGRADVTPPTGYYFMGWVRGDSVAQGQHTRLFARALVLERDGRKVALVATDLGAVPAGMIVHAGQRLADRGFSEQNIVVSASHTHGGPAGYFNFPAFNTVAPARDAPTSFQLTADPQLYTFMVERLVEAIRRADDDLAPAEAGWAESGIEGLTKNRSIEAHLANHGIMREFGEGGVEIDPDGYVHTIDPEVHVLRVDKVSGRRRVPIGIWSTFANHGTVNKPSFEFYNADHHGSATRVVEQAIRRKGNVPRGQVVVNAYGNTDEGDQSSGLDRSGPAAADYVGRIEAATMLRAWRAAGRNMSSEPALDVRWTRMCFCGRETEGGEVAETPTVGLPFLTGSEENRGPLYDETKVPFEGYRLPAPVGPHGHKIGAYTDVPGNMPRAVPLLAVRVADRMVVTVPGEITVDMGRRVRGAVMAAVRGSGVNRAVISGLANEFIQYFTTPEEYDRQHYEGGSTLFGRTSSNLIRDTLADLSEKLVAGQETPPAYDFDSTNGLKPDKPPFPDGASEGRQLEQPNAVRRLQHAEIAWQGGPEGQDRPLDSAFVTVQRLVKRRWRTYASDLGLQVLWHVDDEGRYSAKWEVPLSAPRGTYRIVVSARRYRLESVAFEVRPSNQLTLERTGPRSVAMKYPVAQPEVDFTYRPPRASGGRVVSRIVSRRRRGTEFRVRGPVVSAKDRFGNSAR